MRRFREDIFRLDVLVARQFPMNGPSDLFLIKSNGTYQQISEWKTVGTGEPKADKMVNGLWKNNMKMKDFAELGYCIIKYIEEKGLERTVGVGGKSPSIKYLKDGGEIDTAPDDNEFKEFENAFGSYEEKFRGINF